jgi:predicted nuclease of restriction endonuclease-like (RecB) superfamily
MKIEEQFGTVAQLIRNSRYKALKAVNTTLIELYWNIGEYIYKRIEAAEWGHSVVEDLAKYLQRQDPTLKGFSDKNLWRMRQFYESYRATPILSPLVREISWSNNLVIIMRCKSDEEREFYLRQSRRENYGKRELERQISAGLFERTMLGNSILSPVVRELHPGAANAFKDSYVFDFLNLSEAFNEGDLQRGLIGQMKNFILELGRDFLFID